MSSSETTSRNRILGAYLLFIAGLVVLPGIGLGLLAIAMHPMSYAGAGPSDPSEPVRDLFRSLMFCGAVVVVGIIVGVIGVRLMTKNSSESAPAKQLLDSDRG